MSPLNNDRYAYRVYWSQDTQEYVGHCAEFPDLIWLAKTPELTLSGIRDLVAQTVTDLLLSGAELPEPLSAKEYGGSFLVQVPTELHRRLAIEAVEAGVSLETLAGKKLSLSIN